MRDGERSPPLHFLPCQRFLLKVFGTTHRGKLFWSSHSSETCRVVGTSSAKKKEEGIPVAVRGAECARGGGGDRPFPNRFASGKKKTVASKVCGARGIPLFARLVLLPLLLRSLTQKSW